MHSHPNIFRIICKEIKALYRRLYRVESADSK